MPNRWPDAARLDDQTFDLSQQPRFPNALKEGDGAWRSRTALDAAGGSSRDPSSGFNPSLVDRANATSADIPLTLVGNPFNPKLRRGWEQKYGQAWPKDPKTGRNYDVAHVKALADGGTNVVDNVRPMERTAHIAEHMAAGDFSRWARRASAIAAFGGRVSEAIGPLMVLPDITGILSGRIRTDNFDNFSSDMMGLPSQEDIRHHQEEFRKKYFPDSKPGDLVV